MTQALEGTPEQFSKMPTFNAPSMTEERWCPTIRQTYTRKTFSDLTKIQKIECFNFLFNLGIEITNANDWEDEDVWSSVWYNMIPVDGRFQLTVEHSIAIGMPFQSECQSCVALTLRDLKPGQVLRVYYKLLAILD